MNCLRCKGKMIIKDYQNDRTTESEMMPCPECEGEGTVEEQTNEI